MNKTSIALNRMFTQATFRDLLYYPLKSDTYAYVVKRYIQNPDSKDNGEIISEIYSYMQRNYRNEYFYKNTLLNKLLLGVHKPTTTTALTEIPIGKSKADFILINGKAVVYEIKTALDTFERLESQLEDYYKAFDHVAVLTDEKSKSTIQKLLNDTPVGIYLMTNRNQISAVKEPQPHTKQLNSGEIFKVMNKDEYESLLMQFYTKLPKVPPVKYYSECKKMFCDIDISKSYPAFIKQLKKRNRIEIANYSSVPYELKSLIYFAKFKEQDYNYLFDFLKSNFKG